MEKFFDWLIPILQDVGLKLLISVALFIVCRLIIKTVVKALRNGKAAQKMEPTVAHFLANFVNIVLYIILVVTIIAIMGVPMASVIAAIASAGVAIGLALQGALSNFAGGIMILLFHPFRVGDFIEVDGFSGTVDDIDVFYTFLKTGDNKAVTVPNGAIMSNSVVNYSVNGTRRVDLDIGVAYGNDIERVKAILLEEAAKHELVISDPEPFCRLSAQGDSAITFTLRVWTETANYWQVRFDLLEAVHKRLEAEGVEIPFPQLDVHVKQ